MHNRFPQTPNVPPSGSCQDVDSYDVRTHFRVPIASGHSTFAVEVPQHHLQDSRRRFFFNELHLTPDYYSLEAEQLEIDADPEIDREFERDVKVRISYSDVKTVYGNSYEHSASMTKTSELLAKINQHFETNKPDFCHTTPFFIDWIDLTMQDVQEIDDYVPLLANVYYGEDYSVAKHFDALPVSVRDLKGVNNYLPPVGGTMLDDEIYADRIRLRMWLAPYTKAVFSNVHVFIYDLSFPIEKMGTHSHRQVHLTNDKPYWLTLAIGEEAPKQAVSKTPFKLSMWASSSPVVSRIKHISMPQRDWLNNVKLAETLVQAFRQSSRDCNVVFSIMYDAQEKTFKVNLPDGGQDMAVNVVCEPEFAHRLGFGYQTFISLGMKAEAQKDRYSTEDAKKRAVAVVYDTGPIICTLDHTSSNTTSGSLYQTMAALYPDPAGTLSMPRPVYQCAVHAASSSGAVPINVNARVGAATFPVTFRLLRIYDDQSVADFSWKSKAYVYGVLQGSCPRV